jgi:hypothetical protein
MAKAEVKQELGYMMGFSKITNHVPKTHSLNSFKVTHPLYVRYKERLLNFVILEKPIMYPNSCFTSALAI